VTRTVDIYHFQGQKVKGQLAGGGGICGGLPHSLFITMFEVYSINQSFIAHNTENKCKCYATQYEPDRKA